MVHVYMTGFNIIGRENEKAHVDGECFVDAAKN